MRTFLGLTVLFVLAATASARHLVQDAAGNPYNATAPSYPNVTAALTAANSTPTANLTTLMAALGATGLNLSNLTNVTILAPNNAAFAKRLPALGLTPQQLLAPQNNSTLIDILSYHVIPGIYTSSNLTDSENVTTLQGGNLTVGVDHTTTPPRISFETAPSWPYNATVVVPDIEANGSVVHVVDDVLVPPTLNATTGALNATAGGANITAGSGNMTMGVPNAAAGAPNAVAGTPNATAGAPNATAGLANATAGTNTTA